MKKFSARFVVLAALGSLLALPVMGADVHLGRRNEPGNGYNPNGNGWALHSNLLKNAGHQQASVDLNKYQPPEKNSGSMIGTTVRSDLMGD